MHTHPYTQRNSTLICIQTFRWWHNKRYLDAHIQYTNNNTWTCNRQTSTYTSTNIMAQRLLLEICVFVFSCWSFSSVEPYGEHRKRKKCSRGAGCLHIYSLGFISFPADSTAWEHQMVGRICLLFWATCFSEPEVLRSQRLLRVYGEIILFLRLKKLYLQECGTSGICKMNWSQ